MKMENFYIYQNGKVDVVDKAFRDIVLKKNHAQVKLTFEEFEKVSKAHQAVVLNQQACSQNF